MNRFGFAAAALATFLAAPAFAQAELPAPAGDILLTVSGDIHVANDGDAAVFDREMLVAMPSTTIRTSTIWTEGVQEFTGVELADLMERLGVDGGEMVASAINDYHIEIPVADAVDGGPIIAYARDGKPMSVRDKGPLWIVYPYDDRHEYRTEVIYSRSIWQLDRIEVR